MNGLRQLRDATGGHQVGWKSPTVDDDETASQQRGEGGQTGIEVQCRLSAVQSSVYEDRQFEIDTLRSTKPVKTGKSVSDVIWAT